MTIDYDTWKTTPPDEKPECPICSYYENEECEHDENAREDWKQELKTDAMIEAYESKFEEEDLNAEVSW